MLLDVARKTKFNHFKNGDRQTVFYEFDLARHNQAPYIHKTLKTYLTTGDEIIEYQEDDVYFIFTDGIKTTYILKKRCANNVLNAYQISKEEGMFQ